MTFFNNADNIVNVTSNSNVVINNHISARTVTDVTFNMSNMSNMSNLNKASNLQTNSNNQGSPNSSSTSLIKINKENKLALTNKQVNYNLRIANINKGVRENVNSNSILSINYSD